VQDRCTLRFSTIAIFAFAASSTTIASGGMCEHVVESQLDQYFRRAWQLLLRGGAFLNHGIARSAAYHLALPVSPTSMFSPVGNWFRLHLEAVHSRLGALVSTGKLNLYESLLSKPETDPCQERTAADTK